MGLSPPSNFLLISYFFVRLLFPSLGLWETPRWVKEGKVKKKDMTIFNYSIFLRLHAGKKERVVSNARKGGEREKGKDPLFPSPNKAIISLFQLRFPVFITKKGGKESKKSNFTIHCVFPFTPQKLSPFLPPTQKKPRSIDTTLGFPSHFNCR